MRDPVREHARLPGAGAGDDQQRPLGREDGLALRVVQVGEVRGVGRRDGHPVDASRVYRRARRGRTAARSRAHTAPPATRLSASTAPEAADAATIHADVPGTSADQAIASTTEREHAATPPASPAATSRATKRRPRDPPDGNPGGSSHERGEVCGHHEALQDCEVRRLAHPGRRREEVLGDEVQRSDEGEQADERDAACTADGDTGGRLRELSRDDVHGAERLDGAALRLAPRHAATLERGRVLLEVCLRLAQEPGATRARQPAAQLPQVRLDHAVTASTARTNERHSPRRAESSLRPRRVRLYTRRRRPLAVVQLLCSRPPASSRYRAG